MNTNITSRLLSPDGLSEATLLIDDPPPQEQRLCVPPGGICAVTAPLDKPPNVFNPVVVAPNSVAWPGVPFDPPGGGKTRVLRITNVRADTRQILSENIVMSVAVSCSSPVLLTSPPQIVAILAKPGFVASSSGPARIPQCGHNADLLRGGSASSDFAVTVKEGFPDAFKPRNIEPVQNVPGGPYHTESGFYDPALFREHQNTGQADFGTRIRLRFGPVGDGTSLFVPVRIALTVQGVATGSLQLVDTNTYGDSPPGYTPLPPTVDGFRAAKVSPNTDGMAYAVYEVLSSDPNKIEMAQIPVAVAVDASNLSALGQVTVRVSLAPVNEPVTVSVPRFQDTPTTLPAYEIVVCATCTASAVPVTVRIEGITELVGDLVLTCTGGTPTPAGEPVPQAKIQVFLTNTSITSRVFSTDSGLLSEATLLIDDPPPGQQRQCLPPGGICGVKAPVNGTPNMFNAVVAAPNSVVWRGVPLDPPGDGKTRVLRITNVRADASAASSKQIMMSVVVSAPLLLDSPPLTVAIVAQPGFVASSSGPARIPQCEHNADLLSGRPGSSDFTVTVKEGFLDAFRRRDFEPAQNVPGGPYHTESGFYDPTLFIPPNLGRADFGTRILLRFGPIADGTSLFVPLDIPLTGVGTLQLRLVDTNPYGDSPPGFTPCSKPVTMTATVDGARAAKICSNNGIAYAVYEVLSSDPANIEMAAIPVAVAMEATAANNMLPPRQVTVSVSLAPVNEPPTDSVPRFRDTPITLPAYETVVCATCTASAVRATVRTEGITELVGDLLLTCTGGTPTEAGKPVPLATIQVGLNTNITSRVFAAGLSEATLLIDDPPPGKQHLSAPQSGICGVVTAPYDGTPNVFNAVVTPSGSVVWSCVPFDPPGMGKQRVLRITSVRADASQLAAASPQIVMSVVVSLSPPVLLDVPRQTVAIAQPGLVPSMSSRTAECPADHNAALLGGGSGSSDFTVTLTEGFADAFKPRNIEPANARGGPYHNESGFGNLGLADFGTRIRFRFETIDAGASLFMPVEIPLTLNGTATGQLRMVVTNLAGDSPPGPPVLTAATAKVDGLPAAKISSNNGIAYAVYEVLSSDPANTEMASIPVAVAVEATATNNLSAPVQVRVSVSLAPVNEPPTNSVPRFHGASTPLLGSQTVVCSPPTPTTIFVIFERAVPLANFLTTTTLNANPATLAAIAGGALEIREQLIYNPGTSNLTSTLFLVATGSPLPSPDGTLTGLNLVTNTTITVSQIRCSPLPSLLFVGTVSGSTPSSEGYLWGGSLVGASYSLGLGYTTDTPAKINNVTETVAGVVTLYAASATGTVSLPGGTCGITGEVQGH